METCDITIRAGAEQEVAIVAPAEVSDPHHAEVHHD
jgi:hypothetical protein